MRIVIVIALLGFASTAFAQDVQFDKAIISYYLSRHQLYISINGKEYIEDSATLQYSRKYANDLHPFIAKVQEFENKAWLCTDIQQQPASNGSRAYLAYLKKKKDE